MFAFVLATAFAADPCPAGQERSDFTNGACCWPGQAHNGASCTGIPRCPDGWRTLPDRCEAKQDRPAPAPARFKRNVQFSSSQFSGQVLFVEGTEIGRLPTAVQLTAGEHTYQVQNSQGGLLHQSTLRVRDREGNQIEHIVSTP